LFTACSSLWQKEYLRSAQLRPSEIGTGNVCCFWRHCWQSSGKLYCYILKMNVIWFLWKMNRIQQNTKKIGNACWYAHCSNKLISYRWKYRPLLKLESFCVSFLLFFQCRRWETVFLALPFVVNKDEYKSEMLCRNFL
jgi:hypothetical protein